MELSLKFCKLCSETKSIDMFYKKNNSTHYACKDCFKKKALLRYTENKNIILKGLKDNYNKEVCKKKNKLQHEKHREKRLLSMKKYYSEVKKPSRLKFYGFNSNEEFEKYIEDIDSKCEICSEELDFNSKFKVHCDHQHSSGIFRGVLCNKCNMAIGLMNDNVFNLKKAIDYLNERNEK